MTTDADTITRLQGEARVMLDLLKEAHSVIGTLDPEDESEAENIDILMSKIWAIRVAKAGRPD